MIRKMVNFTSNQESTNQNNGLFLLARLAKRKSGEKKEKEERKKKKKGTSNMQARIRRNIYSHTITEGTSFVESNL